MTRKRWALVAVAVVVAAVVTARIVYVNLSAPHVPVEHYGVGERVELRAPFSLSAMPKTPTAIR